MSTCGSNADPLHKEVICPVLLELAGAGTQIQVQDVIDQLADYIVEQTDPPVTLDYARSLWTKRFFQAAKLAEVVLVKGVPCWEPVVTRINEKAKNNDDSDNHDSSNTISNSASNSTSNTSSNPVSNTSSNTSSSSSSSMKYLLTEDDKANIEKMFNTLDPANFWYLKTTCDQAAKDNVDPEAVETKMKRFALNCAYHHPCHSMILDLGDDHWKDVFSEEEMIELHEYGKPVLRSLPQEFTVQLDHIARLNSPIDAYRFGNSLEHDPVAEPLKAWLSLTLSNTSYLFLKNDKDDIAAYSETDKLYRLWGFINNVFDGSNIRAISKEKSSVANSLAKNNKRKLSAVEQLNNIKMGRKMDTIYKSGNIELGCLEIGGAPCQTKAWNDSMMKMPFVMKDMLISILKKTAAKIDEVHIIGYNINGLDVNMMDMDAPMGYVTRIRRLKEMSYPSNSDDYITCMIPLLQLAVLGKVIMDDTLKTINHTPRSLSVSNHPSARLNFPPCFLPSSTASSSKKPRSQL
ncbi:hypothetical protein RO3G_08569 [Lichtheimia corymbifera JMRC:FSU:9682]|uniref:Uncharacterized protein n=1 Tax=Lichtheimia corymbifera JMRC:FSU:9682 TaxID=1263082 RepID=A0A068RW10_9FUNG|nr:hypothetical protein RO3G_08569 [Lichtheimia corymbifera JMRC:FSU:9682]